MRRISLSFLAFSLSSVALAFEPGTYRPGAPYQGGMVQTPNQCAAYCAADQQCQGWNFVMQNPMVQAGMCELNSQAARPISRGSSISGLNPAMQRQRQSYAQPQNYAPQNHPNSGYPSYAGQVDTSQRTQSVPSARVNHAQGQTTRIGTPQYAPPAAPAINSQILAMTPQAYGQTQNYRPAPQAPYRQPAPQPQPQAESYNAPVNWNTAPSAAPQHPSQMGYQQPSVAHSAPQPAPQNYAETTAPQTQPHQTRTPHRARRNGSGLFNIRQISKRPQTGMSPSTPQNITGQPQQQQAAQPQRPPQVQAQAPYAAPTTAPNNGYAPAPHASQAPQASAPYAPHSMQGRPNVSVPSELSPQGNVGVMRPKVIDSLFGSLYDDVTIPIPVDPAAIAANPDAPIPTVASVPVNPVEQSILAGAQP